jgi:(2Fe-2S) ferredoxin
MNQTILVCQNRTCKSSGSSQVLKAFQAYSITHTQFVGCGCLGKCGNGPMVLILPQKIWYERVSVEKVKTIVEQYS